ncbi:MAG: hypothetical protein COV66_14080 [Nitrospinae bacterium CG11_big_fil_rev_8_21_14_0_20_45_15]|nr:MAG: hypothetical protein COV66_14080 [Nitrospinae bacterium CG11_big_fil_rev_8_21_14_0_20_45_15]
MTKFLYLHGFASSPDSNKARAFKQKFSDLSVPLEIASLDGGDFRNLTLSSQMNIVNQYLDQFPDDHFAVIGSSMGGYLAALAANLRPEIKAIYLMAPGFNFLQRWKTKWKEGDENNPPCAKEIKVFHYGVNEWTILNSGIFDDAEKWGKASLTRELPTRIVHGIHDDTVPIEVSRQHISRLKSGSLVELDSDHGLLSHIQWIVDDCADFFFNKRDWLTV